MVVICRRTYKSIYDINPKPVKSFESLHTERNVHSFLLPDFLMPTRFLFTELGRLSRNHRKRYPNPYDLNYFAVLVSELDRLSF